MPGFLDQYGTSDARREKVIKIIWISFASAAVLAGVLFFIFHNYQQERQVKRFLELLGSHDYSSAYALWVRTDQDRRGYPMDTFMQDWGPKSSHGDVGAARIVKSRSCGSGVILTVDFGGNQLERF